MKISNLISSMRKFHCDSKRMKFGYTNFVNYLNKIIELAKANDDTEESKLIHNYGFKLEIWENPDGSKEKVFIMESNANLWDYWFTQIMTESERTLLFGKQAQEKYKESKNKIEN